MKSFLHILIVFILCTTSIITFAQPTSSETNHIQETIPINTPEIITTKTTTILLDQATTYLNQAGRPILPVITKTYTFPMGTIINELVCTPQNIQEQHLQKPINSAQKPYIQTTTMTQNTPTIQDQNLYQSTTLFPETWYRSSIHIGRTNNQIKTILTITLYPIRYLPKTNTITYPTQLEITIDYTPAQHSLQTTDETYDLVIIAPRLFSKKLERLVDHKNTIGVSTTLMTTEQIYKDYTGRDKPEQIKYYIQHAIEEYQTKYVLLVGGMKGIRNWNWYVPVRYSNLDDNSSFETSYISDLYYADIYKYSGVMGTTFDDWDSNGNGVFAEWNNQSRDILDMYPDISIGRLPIRYFWEVDRLIDRIITYETTTFSQPWFNRMAVLGGDTFDDGLLENASQYDEGKLETTQALSYMLGFTQIRIWPEDGDVTLTTQNAIEELSEGHGFVYFTGHGNPTAWVTFPHNDFETKHSIKLRDIQKIDNGDKLPVLIVGGCHNCQFDTTPLNLLTKGATAYYYGELTPKCWGWMFASKKTGGSIATIGNTGLGYGTVGDGGDDELPDNEPDGIPDCIQFLGGWLEPHFFEIYNSSVNILGDVHTQALTDYLDTFNIDWEMDWEENPYTPTLVDCKTVQQWVLFGDPSLRIGGYPPLI